MDSILGDGAYVRDLRVRKSLLRRAVGFFGWERLSFCASASSPEFYFHLKLAHSFYIFILSQSQYPMELHLLPSSHGLSELGQHAWPGAPQTFVLHRPTDEQGEWSAHSGTPVAAQQTFPGVPHDGGSQLQKPSVLHLEPSSHVPIVAVPSKQHAWPGDPHF